MVGFLLGVFLITAVGAGIKFSYEAEIPLESWGLLFWGEHYIIRGLWGLATTAAGAFLAAVIARRRRSLVGALSAIPSVLVWLVGIYFWVFDVPAIQGAGFDPPSLGSKIMSIIMAMATIPVAIFYGEMVDEEVPEAYYSHLDSRRHCILGIKWYHFLWLPIPIYIIVLQSAWAIDYSLDWLKMSWEAGVSLWSVIPSLFLMAIFGTLYLTWTGISRSYDYLINGTHEYSKSETAIGVVKYGLGLPAAAMVLQALIGLLHYGLSKLIE